MTPRTSLCTASRSASLRLRSARGPLLYPTRYLTASGTELVHGQPVCVAAPARVLPGRAGLHPIRDLTASLLSQHRTTCQGCLSTELAHACLPLTQHMR